jgi:hypothetical protein
MTVGNSSQDAADEAARRERLRDEYDSGLDRVHSARQEQRLRDLGVPPDEEEVRGAGFGASGILGELP